MHVSIQFNINNSVNPNHLSLPIRRQGLLGLWKKESLARFSYSEWYSSSNPNSERMTSKPEVVPVSSGLKVGLGEITIHLLQARFCMSARTGEARSRLIT